MQIYTIHSRSTSVQLRTHYTKKGGQNADYHRHPDIDYHCAARFPRSIHDSSENDAPTKI